ncbi:hypothetical protein [Streptomyces sp. NPDC001635]
MNAVNLLAIHTHDATGGQPASCACRRAACGGAESGPGIPASGCTAHGDLIARHHHAFDCPALPADTDLSRLWIIVTKWTADGPVPLRVDAFDRVFLSDLRGSSNLWDVAEGDTAEDAVSAWKARVDEMRAEAARAQAAQIADAQARRQARELAEEALRSTGCRTAHRMLTHPEL